MLKPTVPTEENYHHIHVPTHSQHIRITRRGMLTAPAQTAENR